jgi:uncharacterized membrane protein
MKTLNIALVAALATTLAGCWESGAGNTQINDMMIEPPEVNLVADLPAEAANGTEGNVAAPVDAAEAGAPAPAAPAPAKAAPAAERRAPAPAAPEQEPEDPHAGHDMSTMNHH